jgi:hypothetical protein
MRLTKRTIDGYSIPASCVYENGCNDLRNRHCNDCALVGKDYILNVLKQLCEYEETGLIFSSEENN